MLGEVSLDFDLIWTRTGTSRDLFPLKNGRLLDIGECLIFRPPTYFLNIFGVFVGVCLQKVRFLKVGFGGSSYEIQNLL